MYELLATSRIRRVVDELVDIRQYAGTTLWLNRIGGLRPGIDGEIIARYKGRIKAADILPLDGKAAIKSPSPIRLTQTEVPKYKHGVGFSEKALNLLDRFEQNIATATDVSGLTNYIANELQLLIQGVYTRMEAVSVGMALDGYSYNRLGIVMEDVSWGMPTGLKVTPSVPWSTSGSATPVADLLAVNNTATQTYGIGYDRASMSTTAFLALTNTTEFQNRAKGMLTVNSAVYMPLGNVKAMIPFVENVLGMTIEIDDRQFWYENNDGSEGTTRFLPVDKVILSSTMFDGDRSTWDFTNAPCQEAKPGMVPAMVGGMTGEMGDGYGPFGYATAASPDGNPPGLNLWAVASGFPNKYKEAATAVLTVL